MSEHLVEYARKTCPDNPQAMHMASETRERARWSFEEYKKLADDCVRRFGDGAECPARVKELLRRNQVRPVPTPVGFHADPISS